MRPGDLVYCVQTTARDGAPPLVRTLLATVLRVHADIGWTEVLPCALDLHVEGYHDRGRRLPLVMAAREPYGPLRVAEDAVPTDELRPVFTI